MYVPCHQHTRITMEGHIQFRVLIVERREELYLIYPISVRGKSFRRYINMSSSQSSRHILKS